MLQRWIYEGELEDPHNEFFVACHDIATDDGEVDIWQDKYAIRAAMIPGFIHASLAHKVWIITLCSSLNSRLLDLFCGQVSEFYSLHLQ